MTPILVSDSIISGETDSVIPIVGLSVWRIYAQTRQTVDSIQNIPPDILAYIARIHECITNPIYDIVIDMEVLLHQFYIDIIGEMRIKNNANKQIRDLNYFSDFITDFLGDINTRINTLSFKKSSIDSLKKELLEKFGKFQNTLNYLPKHTTGNKIKVSSLVDKLIAKIEEVRTRVLDFDEIHQ